MSQKYNEQKEKYLFEHDCYNRLFLDEKDEKVIKEMPYRERKIYLEENKIFQDTNLQSETSYKFYRIELWDITNEEFPILIQMNSAKKIDRIHFILDIFFVIFIIGIVFSIASFVF